MDIENLKSNRDFIKLIILIVIPFIIVYGGINVVVQILQIFGFFLVTKGELI